MDLPPGKPNGLLKMQMLLLLLAFFISPALLQQPPVFYHPRQLYYDAPRLRRFEYASAATPIVGGYSAAPAPAIHFQQQTPHFQLLNYRPSYQPLGLDYQQQQLPAPAPPLPPLYPQQSVQYQQRTIAPHAELAKYRYEGCRSSSNPHRTSKPNDPGGTPRIWTRMWPKPEVQVTEVPRKPSTFMIFSCALMLPIRGVMVTS
ncbi:uncharacterized protein LOC6532679 isoform X3 [Drosophila yakuba]|uniref:Uncharacterized protein, isoform B n=1 Tax=Drosophila yakuba TaxID=7245 RepID=A0A0R1DUZ1_DROYA|nr:uncharacterized protein LOC6532679 isoform X3 [Drosophila yakuba]KRK00960.1 uncharacterized protein Dyak_GE21290, isoform B [Drosophila yakuba]